MILLFDLSKFQSSENTKKKGSSIFAFLFLHAAILEIHTLSLLISADKFPISYHDDMHSSHLTSSFHTLSSVLMGHLPLSYFRSPFPSSSLLAPGQNFQNASPLLDFLPAAAAAVNLVGRRNAAFPPALTRRPRSLKGLQAVDGLLSGAKAAQVGKDATETLCIVVHVRDECGRGRRFESFGAEPVGEGGHAAGPVGIWFRGCDLW